MLFSVIERLLPENHAILRSQAVQIVGANEAFVNLPTKKIHLDE